MDCETKISLEVLVSLLKMISRFNWQGYSYAEVKKTLGLSPVTQKSLLYALESIFLIRRIPIYGGGKGEIILLEDQLEEFVLSGGSIESDFSMSSLVYRNLRAQFQYRLGEILALSSYWTRNNARVPIVLKAKNQVLGVMVIEGEEPTLSQRRAAESLLKFESNSKVVFLSTSIKVPVVLNSRLMTAPIGAAI